MDFWMLPLSVAALLSARSWGLLEKFACQRLVWLGLPRVVSIPLVNLFAVPLCVAGGTMFFAIECAVVRRTSR